MTFARTLREAVPTMVAVVATLGIVLLLDAEIGPAVLGIALTLSLSRSQLERDLRGRLEAGIALPVIGLAAAGVGWLLLNARWVGAAVYVAGMTCSILLRLGGGVWRRIGGLLALPFVALLVTPAGGSTRFGPVGHVVVPLLVALLAWAVVTLVQLAARRIGLIRRLPTEPEPAAVAPSRLRPPPAVRLALQMGTSLTAAFVVGFLLFPERWTWIVLSALLVAVGNRGRADVVQKAAHRVVGSAGGTLVALLPIALLDRTPALAIGVAIAAVLLGTLARGFGYAWWALAVTVALSIVQQLAGAPGVLLLERWEEIVIGAVLGVLPAWFLLPIRSGGVIRRRIGAVLRALQDQLAAPTDAGAGELDAAVRELDRVAAPFDELARLTRGRAGGAARWAALTRRAVAAGRGGGSPDARRAVGDARRTLRDPAALTPVLERAVAELEARPAAD